MLLKNGKNKKHNIRLMNGKFNRTVIKMNKVLLRKEETKSGLSKVIVSRVIKTIKRMTQKSKRNHLQEEKQPSFA